MANYDFKTLTPWEFEQLTRDLLKSELNFDFELFKSGRDKGIDLRYSEDKTNTIIVQCKHYAGSTFANLKSNLKNSEFKKIEKLSPDRYILATSLGLTPANKDDISEILGKYLISYSDIITKDTLNAWLSEQPEIERNYINLWACTTNIIERIIHSGIFNYSLAQKDQLKTRLKFYVKNPSFDEAKNILKVQRYCIIAGMPGIGKTTLAEMLLIDYMSDGYEPIRISSDINEAFQTFNPNKKRIYYYDDFLGQTGLDQKLNKNEEQRIIDFCKLCLKTDNTLFVMTTREYILNQAKSVYEKLSKSGIDFNKCIIDISSYALLDRAKILYNHLYFGDIPLEYKEEILNDKHYLDIVRHPSFNPRVVEWMTDYLLTSNIPAEKYVKEFISRLDNPSIIWEHAYNNQLANHTRHLLVVISSFPGLIFLNDCKKLFDSFRKEYYSSFNEPKIHNDFNLSVKEGEGNFLRVDLTAGKQTIQFHNPSIRDYMTYYLSQDLDLLILLIKSCCNFDQLLTIWNSFYSLENNPLIENVELLVLYQSHIARLLGTSSLILSKRYNASGNGGYVYKPTQLDNQVSIVLSLPMPTISLELKGKIKHSLDNIFNNLKSVYYWQGIVDLLDSIDSSQDLFELDLKMYLNKTIDVLPYELNQVDDYRQLATLCENYELVRNKLSKNYDEYAKRLDDNLSEELVYINTVDDIGSLEVCLYDIECIVEIFNCDLQHRLVEIQELLDDLIEQEDEQNEKKSQSPLRQLNQDNEIDDIISLFETLN